MASTLLLKLLLLSLAATATVAVTTASPSNSSSNSPSFYIENDRFMLDGAPFQIISGAIHYFRIHPDLWLDRLTRCKALGLNTIEIYVPWNWHEPFPGQYDFSSPGADVDSFISMAEKLDLKVLLRAGPYICAEWDFGGLPAWLASSAISGGGGGDSATKMKLRSSDPLYLHHVDRWWRVLLPRIAPRLRTNGGPILMVQIENEFGLCNYGNDPDYLRHLASLARELLGDENQVLFTTDPAHATQGGSLPGDEVFTAVDFGPQWFEIDDYFTTQKAMNTPGRAALLDSEFYTGWLSHWGEGMANTSATLLAQDTDIMLRYGNNSASFNFYMVHGGTNFGFWQGANAEIDGRYECHITSYDYSSPISEAGQTCQPGIGGDGCKFQLLRDVIEKYTGKKAPAVPPEPVIKNFGRLDLKAVGTLMDAAGAPIVSEMAWHMEEYGQQRGIIVYRTELDVEQIFEEEEKLFSGGGSGGGGGGTSNDTPILNFVVPPSDYSSVLINGELQGRLVRGGTANLTLPALEIEKVKQLLLYGHRYEGGELSLPSGRESGSSSLTMDVVVEAMGRRNFGCDPPIGVWDTKGLQSTDVRLNGKTIKGPWKVYTFEFEDLSRVPQLPHPSSQDHHRRSLKLFSSTSEDATITPGSTAASKVDNDGPIFYRGILRIEGDLAELVTDAAGQLHLADTFLDTRGLGKGVAWVNGFNLGWYWPTMGPQMTLYVPGPVLKPGDNDILILEVEKVGGDAAEAGTVQVEFVDAPDFYGPGKVEKKKEERGGGGRVRRDWGSGGGGGSISNNVVEA